ncbi:MAG: RDD family protein, partial [Synergistaceae bacterium]|nr:RDD family protein [Synergistaceae bacterium]
MKEWYCGIDGRTEGPFSEEKLRELAARGVLTGDTLVWNGDPGNAERGWVRAAETEVAAIFGNAAGSVSQAPPAIQRMETHQAGVGRSSAAQGRDDSPEFVLAPRWRRFLAVLCDSLVGFASIFLAFFLPGLIGNFAFRMISSLFAAILISMLPALIIILTWLGINLRFLYKDGQTIGKKILGVRIANQEGGRARLTSIIFLRLVPFWVLSIIGKAADEKEMLPMFLLHNPALPFISGVCAIILLADILLIFRRDRRTL